MGSARSYRQPNAQMASAECAAVFQPEGSTPEPDEVSKKAFVVAENRWSRLFHGARFEDSQRAQRPELRFRRQSPAQYGHGSSLL